ncbi:hypothetical protein DVDV_2329 [Desulfovibrio sp. DV]|uniref:hypothetical protein n=1 Tax=Desulfovibrio sp. DV TaxID=1844708 RepID=UPI00094B8BDE|nr:hypothetical protein [Desulfovibrio sp. DV]OLN27029.1 hypothetical protein DVDV_2329 [Desulfovibrio sp. DV]
MNDNSPMASRKLWAAVLAIAAVALSRKWSMGLTPDEIQAITDIALTAIGSQAGIDLAEKALPLITKAQIPPETKP